MASPKGIELDAIGGSAAAATAAAAAATASGRPRRRSSLLKHSGGDAGRSSSSSRHGRRRSRTGSTARATATAGWTGGGGSDDDENHGNAGDDHDDYDDHNDRGLLEDDPLHDDEEAGLGARARRQRAAARQQRMWLDQRFLGSTDRLVVGEDAAGSGAGVGAATSPLGLGAPGDHGEGFGFGDGRLGGAADAQSSRLVAALTADERKEADQHVVRRLAINGGLIGLWYLFSLSLSLYNKWMFGSNFPFPLFTTSIHMLVQFVLACIVLYAVPSLRPGGGGGGGGSGRRSAGGNSGGGHGHDRADKEAGRRGGRMTAWFYATRIGPCGAATGLDIGLGNASLKLITLTFYTMCKSSSLAFVLLFAFAFRLETPTVRLVAIIAAMTAGVVMMVAGEVEFDPFGFFLVISAAFFSGFRWGLTQILLLRNPATSNPFSSIFFLAPVMFLTLFVLALPMEGVAAVLAGFRALAAEFGPLRTPLLVLFPGTIAFLMTASEFALLQRTSVVTLSIAGIFKEVLTITTATLVFHDTLTLVNILGLLLTLAAIVVYNYFKIAKMRQQALLDVHKEHHRAVEAEAEAEQLPPPPPHDESATSAGSSSTPSPPPQATPDHDSDGDGDGDSDGDHDAEDAGLLRRPGGAK